MSVYIKNQVLIQLYEANLFAISSLPQKKRLAVILFDNIIEIQLRRLIYDKFSWDKTTWLNGSRSYSKIQRDKSLSDFKRMLSFAVKSDWITDDEREELSFCHSIRNSAYHFGKEDFDYDKCEYELYEIALYIYYKFIKHRFVKWKTCSSIISGAPYPPQPGYEEVHFGNYRSTDDWDVVLHGILDYDKKNISISELISNYLIFKLDQIQHRVEYIENKIEQGIDFNHVLNQYWYMTDQFVYNAKIGNKIDTLNKALVHYAFFRKHKELLDDIEDLDERHRTYQELYARYKKSPEQYLLKIQDIENLKQQSMNLKKDQPAFAIKKLITITNRYDNLQADIEEAYFDIDGYIQFQHDLHRGK